MPILSRGDKEPSKFWSWLAHKPWLALSVLVICDTIHYLVLPFNSKWGIPFTVWSVAAMYFYVGSVRKHRIGVVCGYCMDENPLDGNAEAKKHRRQLKYVHIAEQKRLVFLVIAIAFAFSFLLITPGSRLIILPFAFCWVFFGLNWICSRQHQRLYPWCPFCDHGKGRGPREVVPTPTPVRTDEKVLS